MNPVADVAVVVETERPAQCRGRRRHRRFWQAVKEAEVRAVAIIQRKMPEDWRAAMTYLERKHPKRWGRRVDVTSGDEPIKGVVPVKVETAEEARQALRALGVRTD